MLSFVSSLPAAPAADLVTSLPGFGDLSSLPFKVYSGYLTVPGPFTRTPPAAFGAHTLPLTRSPHAGTVTEYDSLKIHYQLHTAQSGADAPVATWHQGGPGGSSIDVGLYTEMGYFQVSDQGTYANEFAWNKVAHMLYLESPAGSGQSSGYSECIKAGKAVGCKWDDVSQGEAYAHALKAFMTAFPEYASNELYLTGESYFGQYGPNIANWILTHNTTLNLKGIAAGNACWGGDASSVVCNGPNEDRNDIELFHGKALISTKLYKKIQKACSFDPFVEAGAGAGAGASGIECNALIGKAHEAVGPHNIYNLYDNCPDAANLDNAAYEGLTAWELKKALRKRALPGSASSVDVAEKHEQRASRELQGAAAAAPVAKTGGYTWSCGGMSATEKWITSADVVKALHLDAGGGSSFNYARSGPASITLWPFLAKNLRVVIYNGDADACVPYVGNEEWITSLEDSGALTEKDAWTPWYTEKNSGKPPAGYVTTFTVAGAPDKDFSFVTIRLAGHMVPTFQPAAALAFLGRFLGKEPVA